MTNEQWRVAFYSYCCARVYVPVALKEMVGWCEKKIFGGKLLRMCLRGQQSIRKSCGWTLLYNQNWDINSKVAKYLDSYAGIVAFGFPIYRYSRELPLQ